MHERILLDHGAGGLASHRLVSDLFLKYLSGQNESALEDSALLDIGPGRLAFSTDTFTVTPIFFPGGNIGDLAVNGTVNDVAMRGAIPKYLSTGFILEEGLPMADLEKIVASMSEAAKKAGIKIVAGDTKVVPRGAADKIFINTTGIGLVMDHANISASRARPGDKIILSGPMGDHGIAVLCEREGLSLETDIKSDTACLAGMVEKMVSAVGENLHVLRDPTRGGVGTSLNEIAGSSRCGITIYEENLPVRETVKGACDILGLDLIYVANEGKLLAFVNPEIADDLLKTIRNHEYGRQAVIIGQATDRDPGRVVMETIAGGTRIIDMLTGEQLPRIC